MRRLPEKHARICGRYTLLAASRRLFRAAVLVLAVSLMLGTNGRVQAEGVVQDTLNKRCVVCHGCYDAPCQLKLSSPEGWLRGASKQKVYESSRLEDAPLTRLGVDATTTSEWRQKGFFPVTGNDPGGSILAQLIAAGRTPEFELGAALPDSVDLDLSRDLSCPAPGETAQYLKEHPMGGMPYAMAPLPEEDYQQLMAWAMAGAPAGAGAARELPSRISQHVSDIEAFLNGPDTRTRLVARYIYEHLFLAHLHIEGDRSDRFFRLIRSKTPAGTPPQDVATRRPFDDPGTPFTYRLVPISGTILHKEHIVYEIGPTRLARYKELFLDPDWTLSQLPPYSTAAGGNPLSTFRAIPARSRYQFLLDNAEYFVRSFIRGPVCYGQVAVNVIEDRFWVSFLDPDEDLSVSDQAYLNQIVPILELPVALSDGDLNDRITSFLERGPVKYQELRQQRYAREAAENGPPAYAHIWDGDGTKPDARLTVYRNFSSASVVSGFAGRIPETAWVIDFPLFERIYYNLVAGFDVFGNVEHQLTTRIYMDNLRREGERNFLSFLPPDQRQPLHDGWYRGPFVSLMDRWKETPLDTHTPTGIAFGTQNPKQEFLTRLLEIQPQLWDMTDPINRCDGDTCAQAGTVAAELRPLAQTPASFAQFMPNIAVLLVETGNGDEIYTLVHDMAHANVAFIFNEDLRREPDDDSLTIVKGQFSSYPNFVFKVSFDALPDFVEMLTGIRSQAGLVELVATYGVRRTAPDFWQVFDRVQVGLTAQDPLQAGLLDLNRYDDPKTEFSFQQLFDFGFLENQER